MFLIFSLKFVSYFSKLTNNVIFFSYFLLILEALSKGPTPPMFITLILKSQGFQADLSSSSSTCNSHYSYFLLIHIHHLHALFFITTIFTINSMIQHQSAHRHSVSTHSSSDMYRNVLTFPHIFLILLQIICLTFLIDFTNLLFITILVFPSYPYMLDLFQYCPMQIYKLIQKHKNIQQSMLNKFSSTVLAKSINSRILLSTKIPLNVSLYAFSHPNNIIKTSMFSLSLQSRITMMKDTILHQINPKTNIQPQELTGQIKNGSKYMVLTAATIILLSYFLLTNPKVCCKDENPSLQKQLQLLSEYIESNDKNNRIHFLTNAEQLQKMGLKGNTLIWYQMCGIKHIDDEVIDMLIGYDERFANDSIYNTQPGFKIVIDATNVQSMGNNVASTMNGQGDGVIRKFVQVVILKPQEITPIQLNKFLSFKHRRGEKTRMNFSMLYEKIHTYIKEFQEINLNNLRSFANKLGEKSYQGWILMAAPYKDSSNNTKLKNAKKKLNSFVKSKKMFSQFCLKNVVTDEQSLRFLGINDCDNMKDCSQNIYLLVPDSENVVKPGKKVNIEGRTFNIYKVGGANPDNIQNCLIFPSFIEKSHTDAEFLRFNVDMNQNVSQALRNLFETLKKQMKENPESLISQIPKVLSFETARNKAQSQSIQIFLQLSNFDKIVNVYSQGCRYKDDQKYKLITETHKWKFQYNKEDLLPEEIHATDIQKWLKKYNSMTSVERSQSCFYETQTKTESQKKIKKYNSERITGQQYPYIVKGTSNMPGSSQEQVIDNKTKIIFHYSEHCYSCNKFKHIYEEIAGQRKKQIQFYRIDNDKNKIGQGIRNYNSTPVFVLYRNGIPFYFKNGFFTKQIFEDFIDVTTSINTFDLQTLEKNVKDRMKDEQLMKELLQPQ